MKNFNLKLIFNKLLLTVALFGFVGQVNAALITWTGGGVPNDWTDPANWDSGTVPGPMDDVVINAGATVTLSTAFTAASLEIQSGADLIIDVSGVLNLGGDDGVDTNGALDLSSASGSITNNGTINITNAADDGIDSRGTFINNGVIVVDGFGLINSNGDGISVEDASSTPGTFTNTVNGSITIIFTGGGDDGFQLDDVSILINEGTINISSSDCTGDIGIFLDDGGILTNTVTGVINVFDTVDEGIFIEPISVANNDGAITTTNIGQCANATNNGIEVRGTFNNNATGTFKDIGARGDGIRIEDNAPGGVVNNAGTIIIDGASNTNDGIENQGTFNSTGVLEIGCASTVTELEINRDTDLDASCVNFDIPAAGDGGDDYDRIENYGGTLTIGGATAKLDFGTFEPVPDVDCFVIVDGAGAVSGTFAGVILSNSALNFEVNYTATTVEVCIIAMALPVELTSFEGRMQEGTSVLNWETASELNNKGFEIEHSLDGRDFSYVDLVLGNGTTQTASNYSFVHKTPSAGDNYYRLKQIDFDGAFEYSNIVYLENTKNDTPGIIYPNPAISEVTYEGAPATLKVYDALGQLVIHEVTQDEKTTLDISQFEAGVYFMEITTESNETMVKRFIKNK